MQILVTFFKALLEHLTKLIQRDKVASDADTPKDIKRRWDNHVRDSLRND